MLVQKVKNNQACFIAAIKKSLLYTLNIFVALNNSQLTLII